MTHLAAAESLVAALDRAAEEARRVWRHLSTHGHLGEPEDTRPETDVIDPSTGKIISLGKWNADRTEFRSPGRGPSVPSLDTVQQHLGDAQAAVSQLTSAPVPQNPVPTAPPTDRPLQEAPPTAPMGV